MDRLTLGDLGERRILREIIPEYVSGAGDDCAIEPIETGFLTITTDPVPPPAAKVIGGDPDLFWMGWLLVTINASDIAASGARPLSFVAALDLPKDLPIPDFRRLLEGIGASCKKNGLKFVGGNLREAEKISAVGTAFGIAKSEPLRRTGAANGDLLVVIGQGGGFWRDAEKIRRGEALEKMLSPVFSPISQALVMHKLNEHKLIACAMDSSDGLAPTLVELALVNNLGISVDLERIRKSSPKDTLERVERLWMGWGDWTVVTAVKTENFTEVEAILSEKGAAYTVIGKFSNALDGVYLYDGDRSIPIPRLESERFAYDSWFLGGIDEYIKRIQDFELP